MSQRVRNSYLHSCNVYIENEDEGGEKDSLATYFNTECSKSHATHGETQYAFYLFIIMPISYTVLKMSTITLFTEMHTTNHICEHILQCTS
jgi:hypothetical protein